MTKIEASLVRDGDKIVTGHPRGLFYLAFTEAWERFSYYGMTALLALFMVNQLLLPGHVEQIAGFAGFRAAVESLVGPLSTQALARTRTHPAGLAVTGSLLPGQEIPDFGRWSGRGKRASGRTSCAHLGGRLRAV